MCPLACCETASVASPGSWPKPALNPTLRLPCQENPPFDIGSFEIPLLEYTRVDVSDKPVSLPESQRNLPVTGWMGLAKDAYKNEEMAGVRIYTRGRS